MNKIIDEARAFAYNLYRTGSKMSHSEAVEVVYSAMLARGYYDYHMKDWINTAITIF